MRRMVFVAAMMVAVSLAWLVPTIAAAPQDDGAACRQEARELMIAESSEGTMGDFNSDVLMGNEPNPENYYSPGTHIGPADANAIDPGSIAGEVLPSAAPGPKTMSGAWFGPAETQELIRTVCGS